MSYLLTFPGNLLCQERESGQLRQHPIDAIPGDAEPLHIDIDIEILRGTYDTFVRNARPALDCEIGVGSLGPLRITRASDGRCVNLSRGGLFLTAYQEVRLQQSEPHEWETFLPITQTDIDVLRSILLSAWVIRSSGVLVAQGESRLDVWFQLHFGPLAIDLRHQLPFDLASWPFRLVLLRDGWRLESVCRFRPLIYFAGFRHPVVLQQLYESIRSLLEIGGYTGKILVLTDQPREVLVQNLPELDPSQLLIWQTNPRDYLGYVAARYLIVDIPLAQQFQPIIYVDADTLFDADILPMLLAVARSDRIAAPIEPFSPLRTASSVGSTLLQLDGCSPRFAVGFNAGTLGVPNLAMHGATLRLIRTITANYADKERKRDLGWIEQEVANYVSYRLADFDTHLITRHVRFAGWPGTEPDLECRGGLVHFWPAGGPEPTLEAMRKYRRRLDALPRPP